MLYVVIVQETLDMAFINFMMGLLSPFGDERIFSYAYIILQNFNNYTIFSVFKPSNILKLNITMAYMLKDFEQI
jgi:hypothetical protein